ATHPRTLSRVPEPVHRKPRTGKSDAGKPPVRFGWGATEQSVLYPHPVGKLFSDDGTHTVPDRPSQSELSARRRGTNNLKAGIQNSSIEPSIGARGIS